MQRFWVVTIVSLVAGMGIFFGVNNPGIPDANGLTATSDSFYRTQTLLALVLGLVGGLAGGWFARERIRFIWRRDDADFLNRVVAAAVWTVIGAFILVLLVSMGWAVTRTAIPGGSVGRVLKLIGEFKYLQAPLLGGAMAAAGFLAVATTSNWAGKIALVPRAVTNRLYVRS